ncbi:phosphonoacetaldehyde hydrolase [Bordetella holmesii]|nr:phosphonoacetaldehyde hydrolase [Bordetella holmesii]QGE08355.1 phosphonoacetaldehyde hydrolase [Bordetella holmesii]QGE11593.1 phosphonoacetaldehyde hydrolase [Bordetella holmesii]QGE95959.1 phosphonoacetaldehyde hydrolase [Bordetella holmesii]QJP54738.1 phosphonoacetaldehyde hydrolase [Bordetella holmesii]
MEEGRRAGMWSVGVLLSGNAAGLSLSEWQALQDDARNQARERARQVFAPAQPHYFIDTVAELPGVLSAIAARLARGERP